MVSIKNKYIYGLDLSIACSGVTIYDYINKEFIIIDSFETNNKDTHGKRLHKQRNYFKDLMNKYPPHELAIESGFTRFNKATQVLYRVHGVVNELFHEVKQYYYPPKTVKKVITDNGNAKKDVVAQTILDKYPSLNFKNEDESDSCAVLLTHLDRKYPNT